MTTPQIVEAKQGILIEEQLLQSAGLGNHLQIIVQAGEIRIVTANTPAPALSSEKGWKVFRALGNNPGKGKLPNAAVDHDRYLYGKH
ncbi:MAG: hypothetical protein HZC38_16620 [Chloroflexi bacterium]|nr:hypothetical protein [Chloroflexota bacterium]MBI5350986.1 hypothetical protein [Chloroflexota bacterium]MBI5715024.1 hypothetical protein [Chloroflexota bacterium]